MLSSQLSIPNNVFTSAGMLRPTIASNRPCIHRSVLERFRQVPRYHPTALLRLTFRLWDDSSGATKEVRGIAGLSALAHPAEVEA